MTPATAILETVLYAEDIPAAQAFYEEVFGLEVATLVPGTLVFFHCGAGMLLIFNPERSARPDPNNPIPRHGATGPGHVCFTAEDAEEVARWRAHFVALGHEIECDHVWERSGAHSVYIRDPAGNSVEVGERKMWRR